MGGKEAGTICFFRSNLFTLFEKMNVNIHLNKLVSVWEYMCTGDRTIHWHDVY